MNSPYGGAWTEALHDVPAAGHHLSPTMNLPRPLRRCLAPLLLGIAAASLVPAAPAAADDAVVRSICFPVTEPVTYIDDFGAPRGGHTHEGNDLIGQRLYHIVAPANGVIVQMTGPGATSGTGGYSLRMRDDQGWYYAFLHINNDTPGTDDGLATVDQAFAPGMAVGRRVWAGEWLAYMGDSGDAEATSPHLHFEMRTPAPSVWDSTAVSPYRSLQAAARCAAPRRTVGDRDGDGRADAGVIRETSTQALSWLFSQSGLGDRTDTIGSHGDVPVPADYDGDGRLDPAVWQPTSPGKLKMQVASSATPTTQLFGEPGDDPTVVGDYDGDGRADIAVYRPGRPSTWFIMLSSGGYRIEQWGEAADIAVPADYDGDGRTDIAVRRDDGVSTWFYIDGSRMGFKLVNFGQASDHVVSADYDGDGRADVSVVRNTGGILTWFIANSGGGVSVYQFGERATDREIPADYDGDGRVDLAVWRSGTPGYVYVLRSSGGVTVFAYGRAGDSPIAPNVVR
jgi:murein DD-endopeptidase MepM/ murein hydrolase activator NlpD